MTSRQIAIFFAFWPTTGLTLHQNRLLLLVTGPLRTTSALMEFS
jgi:hypothetical protein